ncbi:MAG: indole-3-glycerol phosphate synthase TrpC [Saprospiraceae bacterium]|nr:indole-3-glycerol phosphate synthase TrpC [Saprospiraceae bacterium]
MNILDTIIAEKHREVATRKAVCTVQELESRPLFAASRRSLRTALLRENASGVIAEFKRRSPSKGDIFAGANALEITRGYEVAGATALSVLTDTQFFGGSSDDLSTARAATNIPILRKDFIIDEYQLVEARAIGADAILLIAANLEKTQLRSLAECAKQLGLDVLMEVHNQEELDWWNPWVDAVGVNNRNLKNFEVSVQTSFQLFEKMPKESICISESGIDDPELVFALKNIGFQGFLIGEFFMKTSTPAEKCKEFIEQLRQLDALRNGAIATSL